ncbi:MAG: dihydroorotase [Lachnospiraceae bacterium]|nr:dihydroorotase [Lachnospiraceae bacterium]
MTILIKNGRIIDPMSNRDEVADLYVEDGIVSQVGKEIEREAERIIDATDLLVMPGFIDLHVHLREPGLEHKETIETGAMAAARGGFTTICAMPNTKPVVDSREVVEDIYKRAEKAKCHVLQVGAVTKGQMGAELADIREMKQAGICAISEDGKSVMDSKLYKEAMVIAKEEKLPVFAHCEDKNLVGKGALNAGKKAEELGVEGITNAVEDIITARDILLSKETGARLHLCHCSTADSVRMVEEAKKEGLLVTAEVCPHHFTLTEDDIEGSDTNYKMNPPLRSKADKEALIEGLKNNIMDVISTDHAPHHADEKAKPMAEAPFGIVGLETAYALTNSELVEKGYLSQKQLVEKMSANPAKVLGMDKGCIGEGKVADIVITNPKEEYVIDVNEFASKGKNTPFNGRKVTGKVKYTILAGELVYEA